MIFCSSFRRCQLLEHLLQIISSLGDNPQSGTSDHIEAMVDGRLPDAPLGHLPALVVDVLQFCASQIIAELKVSPATPKSRNVQLRWGQIQSNLFTKSAEGKVLLSVLCAKYKYVVQISRHDLVKTENLSKSFASCLELGAGMFGIDVAATISASARAGGAEGETYMNRHWGSFF